MGSMATCSNRHVDVVQQELIDCNMTRMSADIDLMSWRSLGYTLIPYGLAYLMTFHWHSVICHPSPILLAHLWSPITNYHLLEVIDM